MRRKLHRELGDVVLEALEDEQVVEVMVNEDGRVWCDRLGEGMSLLPETFSPERAESLVGTVAALLETVANAEHPIVEGELPFFGFRFEGLVPPVVPRATAAIRKRAKLLFTLDDYERLRGAGALVPAHQPAEQARGHDRAPWHRRGSMPGPDHASLGRSA